MEDIFQIQMLGGFFIRRGDREIALSGRSKKLSLLLACLILERERPVPAGELAGLLWEGQALDNIPSNSLKALLHRARGLLDHLGEAAGRTLLLSREGCCQWNPEIPIELDVERFQALACGDSLPQGLEALALYRGDFLPGLEGCLWAADRAGALLEAYLQTASRVLPLLAGEGRWQQAAELAGQAMERSPCRDELCRWRMEALLHLERRDEAAQVYEAFQEVLLSRLGVIPSDPLRELYREVRRDRDPRAISPVTLLERLREPPRPGALLCEYDFFRIICHSMVRMAGRSGEPLHVALLSVTGSQGAPLPQHSLERCMDNLQGIILSHLRQGDAAARCSASQFALLLPQASYDNGVRVCARITRAFGRQFPHSPAVLQVSVQSLLSGL